ncbi:hypothetical protein RRF57_011908 [Xylaria bambusicola]|uniref:Uncharacterized protein n=1 Tax=Xylaria bambusicola TaxID=326684 RepID=A0AAN7V145_9PEZI
MEPNIGNSKKDKEKGDKEGTIPARLSPATPNGATTVITDRQPSEFMTSTSTTRPLARTLGLPSAVGDG